jgi:hypothetical protein
MASSGLPYLAPDQLLRWREAVAAARGPTCDGRSTRQPRPACMPRAATRSRSSGSRRASTPTTRGETCSAGRGSSCGPGRAAHERQASWLRARGQRGGLCATGSTPMRERRSTSARDQESGRRFDPGRRSGQGRPSLVERRGSAGGPQVLDPCFMVALLESSKPSSRRAPDREASTSRHRRSVCSPRSPTSIRSWPGRRGRPRQASSAPSTGTACTVVVPPER